MAFQLRIYDVKIVKGRSLIKSVPEDRIADAPVFSVASRADAADTAAWRNKTLIGVLEMMHAAAMRQNLSLFVLMPYHKAVFDRLAPMPGLTTVQNFSVAGLSELELLFVDMALAAGCELFVLDPQSTLSANIARMRAGLEVLYANLHVKPFRDCAGFG